jgi:hypothetical protein
MTQHESNVEILEQLGRRYEAGFVTDIESDSLPPGLDEDVVRFLSAKKEEPEWMTQWRLAAYRHWLTMPMPNWAKLEIAPIDFQSISYYSAPKAKYASLDEVPQELLDTYEKLGVPLHERAKLAGVAVDAVFDSVSVGTTFRKELAEKGIIFCSLSEAVQRTSRAGAAVPRHGRADTDNFFAALNSAVFRRQRSCYIPKGVRCPMELSDVLPHQRENTGQFERTLIIAEEGAYVSYLEGCTAPMRDENQLHAAVVELMRWKTRDQVLHGAELVSRRRRTARRHLQLRDQARRLPRCAFEDFVDAGGNRFGDHLEIPERVLLGDELGRRVPFGRADQPPPAGRHRHQDDPHRQAQPSRRSCRKGISAGAGRTPTAAW